MQEKDGADMNRDLEQYARLIPFLGKTLGNTFEAVLFDVTDPALPIAAAANTREGGPERLRAFLREAMDSALALARGCLVNRAVSVGLSKMLKVSVLFLRDGQEAVIGALCLSMRCENFLWLQGLVMDMLRFDTEDLDAPEPEEPASALREPTLDAITEYATEFGLVPEQATPDERLEFILDLYEVGIFNLKGAVAKTAEVLQISEQTVYRYLARLRRAQE